MSPFVCYKLGVVCSQCYCVWRVEHVGHIYCVSLVRRCTMQRNRLRVTQLPDDCVAIVHCFECCNAIIQFCTKNCIFSCPLLFRPHLGRRHHIYRKVVGMLIWALLVRPDLQFTAKDHTRHLAAPSDWDWGHLKHTLRYIKETLHYKFLISPRLPE